MTEPPRRPRGRLLLWLLSAAAAVTAGVAFAVNATAPPAPVPAQAEVTEASGEDVHRMCAACHAYPPPDSFPKADWRTEVKKGFDFFHADLKYRLDYPSLESVVRYYEARAPEVLDSIPQADGGPAPATFDRRDVSFPDAGTPPGAAHVSLVHLFSRDKLDVLVCDAVGKRVLVYSPYESPATWRVIATGLCCAHAEVVDLDGDGVNDVVLACLGNFYATDDKVGAVVLLKGAADRTFTPITLLDGIGRVADVRPADFRGAGKPDLVVAEFGWHRTGSILLLENHTTDPAKPVFTPRTLDDRHGTTHVPVGDLNGDGRPDFVAVISQEHETVVAFLNEGGGKFRKETIYTAPHPTWGCNGVQLVDLDGDGDLDVLLTNGDSLDAPYLLKPYHGLTWLENKGTYPFEPHRLADCYGAGSPVTADFDCDGRLDVAVVTFLPTEFFPQRAQRRLDSVLLLSQVAPGKFERHSLEVAACDHLTCAAGDLDGTGRPGLVVGNHVRTDRAAPGLTILRNTTPKRKP